MGLEDHLPKETEKQYLQCKVDKALVERVKPVLRRRNLDWSDFIEAAMKSFIEENESVDETSQN